MEYIKNFKWEDNKYPRGRSLIEITALITDVDNFFKTSIII